MDLQKYTRTFIDLPDANQISLSNAAGLLNLDLTNYDLHRALDDSFLCADVLKKTYDEDKLKECVIDVENSDFYERIMFKPYYISEIDNEHIDRSHLEMKCHVCGSPAKQKTGFKATNSKAFFAEFDCKNCNERYRLTLRFKKTFDRVTVNRSEKVLTSDDKHN